MDENLRKTVIIRKNPLNQEKALSEISELVRSIKFGSLTIHIEDGKIIQVDKNEKIRFGK